MAYTAAYRKEVEEKLGLVLPIETRAMFGGVGIYAEGLIFAIIAEDKLYFKVSDLNRADFEEAGMGPFYHYDSPTPMAYWQLPPASSTTRTNCRCGSTNRSRSPASPRARSPNGISSPASTNRR